MSIFGLFTLVFLLATHEAFPIFLNLFSPAAAEVNRMLPHFLTRHVRSNQPIRHEHAQAITRAIPAPFIAPPTPRQTTRCTCSPHSWPPNNRLVTRARLSPAGASSAQMMQRDAVRRLGNADGVHFGGRTGYDN